MLDAGAQAPHEAMLKVRYMQLLRGAPLLTHSLLAPWTW